MLLSDCNPMPALCYALEALFEASLAFKPLFEPLLRVLRPALLPLSFAYGPQAESLSLETEPHKEACQAQLSTHRALPSMLVLDLNNHRTLSAFSADCIPSRSLRPFGVRT